MKITAVQRLEFDGSTFGLNRNILIIYREVSFLIPESEVQSIYYVFDLGSVPQNLLKLRSLRF